MKEIDKQISESKTYQEGTKLKGNTQLLLRNLYQLINNFNPISGPIVNSLFLAPCQLAKLNAIIMCNPAGFVNNNMLGVVNALQGGSKIISNHHKKKYFSRIYDTKEKRMVSIKSERGKEILLGYFGFIFLNLLI